MPAKRTRKPKRVEVHLKATLHNGEGHPELQFPDPITGEMIGGQVAASRMSMRYRHCVMPWARRQGKSSYRKQYFVNRATITPGEYYAGVCFPDHTTAFKIAENFRLSWGDMVSDYKVNDKDQDRWIDIGPFAPPYEDPPAWFTEPMKRNWTRCWKGDKNTKCRVYFWGAAHPHYAKIQGFPHHFNDIHWDETQQIHPLAYIPVRPMLRDVRGHEVFTGTPDYREIGNAEFKKWWDMAGESKWMKRGWFRMRIPDGSNPHVPAADLEEEMETASLEVIQQTMFAKFLTGHGALFKNIDRVCILPYLDAESEEIGWAKELRTKYGLVSMQIWIHEAKPRDGHTYALTIDWARSPTGDYSVLGVYDLSRGKQVALFRWRGEDFTEQMEVVLAVQKHYGASECHSDEHGMGEPMSDFMRRRKSVGFTGHKYGRRKPDYVRRGQVLFMDLDVELIDCGVQKREFEDFAAFESDTPGNDSIKYSAPMGKNDDFVTSFLLVAKSLTISGRRDVIEPEEPPTPIVDEKMQTTLELWARGQMTPFDQMSQGGGCLVV